VIQVEGEVRDEARMRMGEPLKLREMSVANTDILYFYGTLYTVQRF
jgi:hypothetical protein